ncbi:unannotated protein [freshwater metagenome]|uniref:Unannotated protein n=1 Tax=freshwater metagenome TaxID=449393 RepID=A0A6J6J5N3_9ZZZZ|nr:hypothetical protein [Actinomycetota bacterium]
MVADKENDKNLFGRPRRSSFVAASAENADFVPILPAVGSTPIPAASDVNYFPTVATGQPSLREPAPPARLVVPTRKSMSEEEIATVFAESAEMTSSEQILMLDAQVTLREDDLRTAKEFVAHLRLTKPADAQSLLDELKQVFADVDPKIASLSLSDEPMSDTPTKDVNDTLGASTTQTVTSSTSTLATLLDSTSSAVPARQISQGQSVNGRHRGWNVVMLVATMVAILIPVTSAVFTGFGSPVPVNTELMLNSSGVFAAIVALLAALPLVLLSRSTSIRHALSTRAAIQRVAGAIGGTLLWTIGSLVVLVGLLTVLLVTSQGVGLQLNSIPGVASTLAQFAPHAHASVLVVALIVIVGFVIASLSRRAFRGVVLALAGFTLIGPTIVILTGLAVVATTNTGAVLTSENIVIATGIIPIGVILFAGIESGTATVVRRDENAVIGLPLYIGLAAGLGFAAWVLVAGMSPDALGDLLVGSNPALHVVAASAELALISGVIAFAVPLILISALVGRSLMMVTVRDDRDASSVLLRVIVIVVPVTLLGLDLTGIAGDITMVLPGIPFVSIPLMVIIGLMAGASIASRREIGGVARVINAVLSTLLMAVGLALTSWSVPGLTSIYDSSIAPLATTLGISGALVLIVPTAVLVLSFVVSLLVSAPSALRSNRTA